MIVGVPREIKSNEHRVALVPGGVTQLVRQGHQVIVEEGAGEGSGFPDELYHEVGAQLYSDVESLWKDSDMIMKVKEPVGPEYDRLRKGQIVFTYFHFAADMELTQAVLDSGCIAIAYETVEKPDKSLPLLIPMSEVAGRMAAQEGAKFLEKSNGGRGILMAGIPGVAPANVMVIGGGIVGVNAAKIASGMGGHTTLMDIDMEKLRYLDDVMPRNVETIFSSEANIKRYLPLMDLVIGAVLRPGAKAPKLITRDMLGMMKPGSMLVDVAIDQGGCFETSRPTTHDDPVYIVDDVVHYCVTNMPGAVPFTSTMGLTNVTLPYAMQIANKGWQKAMRENNELQRGLNMAYGELTHEAVAEAFDMEYADPSSVLS